MKEEEGKGKRLELELEKEKEKWLRRKHDADWCVMQKLQMHKYNALCILEDRGGTGGMVGVVGR